MQITAYFCLVDSYFLVGFHATGFRASHVSMMFNVILLDFVAAEILNLSHLKSDICLAACMHNFTHTYMSAQT